MTVEEYAELLKANKNIILHGAPGTGKTYLAKQIAEELGATEENSRLGFVQFHPSYDYTDFVEGFRPVGDNKFERIDGTFKEFCGKAKTEYSKPYEEYVANIIKNKKEELLEFLNEEDIKSISKSLEDNIKKKEAEKLYENFDKKLAKEEYIETYEERYGNQWLKKFEDSIYVQKNKENFEKFGQGTVGAKKDTIIKEIIENKLTVKSSIGALPSIIYAIEKFYENSQKPFVFIIDEINRGEISKIFGELFFAIDPGYRGEKGRVQTQYQNMIIDDNDPFKGGFYVPDNVHIIGTMNDIDRSVESMDFAMRRRFTFLEVTAKETQNKILNTSNEELKDEDGDEIAALREIMTELNNKIVDKEIGLSEAYQIGAAYFTKYFKYKKAVKSKGTLDKKALKNLWEYDLCPLLREYLRGKFNENQINEKIGKLKPKELEEAHDNETDNPNGQQ